MSRHETQQAQSFPLNELLAGIVTIDIPSDVPITGISMDSRYTEPGNLFIACIGEKVNGKDYIPQALANGAVAIICESPAKQLFRRTPYIYVEDPVPTINCADIKLHLSTIAGKFYNNPSKDMMVVGITGTNGKTTCSHFISQCLNNLESEAPSAVIGTLGYGQVENLQTLQHTTPNAIRTQQICAELKQQGVETLAMEVSSHGLTQGRVEDISFDIAVFTNLSHDHLDYHQDMASYGKAKQRLFNLPGLEHGVINLDDPYSDELIKHLPKDVQILGYSLSAEKAQNYPFPCVVAQQYQLVDGYWQITVTTPWGKGEFSSQLLGEFNLRNLLATLSVLGLMNIPLNDALAQLQRLKHIDGRMDCYGGGAHPLFVVDFAHTPDALEKALQAISQHQCQQLWCVFGCGGDRDSEKRPLMGRIVEQYVDHVIITDDNPRFEDPDHITDDILNGITQKEKVQVIHDRHQAIAYAFREAKPKDIVLIAGKGHERYQQIGTQKKPFNDGEVIKRYLEDKELCQF